MVETERRVRLLGLYEERRDEPRATDRDWGEGLDGVSRSPRERRRAKNPNAMGSSELPPLSRRNTPLSNRGLCQAALIPSAQGRRLRTIAFRIVSNLRMHATMASLCGLPAATSRS